MTTSAYRNPWNVNDGSQGHRRVVGEDVACRWPWRSAATGCAAPRPAPSTSACRTVDGVTGLGPGRRAGRRRPRSGPRRAGSTRRGPRPAAAAGCSVSTTRTGGATCGSRTAEVEGHDGRPATRRCRRSPARSQPSWRAAQVDRAAVVVVGRPDLPGGRPPALVRRHDDRAAVGQLDLELGQQPELPPVPAPVVVGVPADPAAVPAVAQDAGEHVVAVGEQVRHVVGDRRAADGRRRSSRGRADGRPPGAR